MRLASDLGLPADGYQGNWIPHQLRRAVEDGVFFVGDSAGHCLPLTAEGIRTALYFGLACGRELRAVLDGQSHARAGAGPLRAPSRTPTRASSAGCWRSSGPSGQMTPSRAAGGAGEGPSRAGAWRAGRSRTTWRSRRPRSSPPGRRQVLERQREQADALLDGRLGQVGVAEHEPVVARARPQVAVAERVDPDRAATGGAHQGEPVDRRGQAHDRVQAGRHAGHARAGQVAGDRRHERVAPRAVAAARLAQMAVVVAGSRSAGRARAARASASRRRPGACCSATASTSRCGQHQPAEPQRRGERLADGPHVRHAVGGEALQRAPAAGGRSGTRRRSRPRSRAPRGVARPRQQRRPPARPKRRRRSATGGRG